MKAETKMKGARSLDNEAGMVLYHEALKKKKAKRNAENGERSPNHAVEKDLSHRWAQIGHG